MNKTRRHFLKGSALCGAVAAAFASPGLPGLSFAALAQSKVDMEELAVAGPLGEVVIGDADAAVTIVEYASLTCSHCATFHKEVLPDLKSKYLDTGQAKLYFREFPLDPLATIAFMLARCLPEARYLPFVDVLFHNQRAWTRTNDPLGALKLLSKQAGMSEETFDKCTQNQQLLDGVKWVQDRAASKFGVRSTPTFFVNGEMAVGVLSLEEFDKLIERHS